VDVGSPLLALLRCLLEVFVLVSFCCLFVKNTGIWYLLLYHVIKWLCCFDKIVLVGKLKRMIHFPTVLKKALRVIEMYYKTPEMLH